MINTIVNSVLHEYFANHPKETSSCGAYSEGDYSRAVIVYSNTLLISFVFFVFFSKALKTNKKIKQNQPLLNDYGRSRQVLNALHASFQINQRQ